jgi:hypothetical protein
MTRALQAFDAGSIPVTRSSPENGEIMDTPPVRPIPGRVVSASIYVPADSATDYDGPRDVWHEVDGATVDRLLETQRPPTTFWLDECRTVDGGPLISQLEGFTVEVIDP